jgi:hypothetical protein
VARRDLLPADSELGRTVIDAATCPACQAPLGLPCLDPLGEPNSVVHDARRDSYLEGLLVAIAEMAAIAANATTERDRLIVAAVAAGATTRQIGDAAGITHTSVQYIARRDATDD